MQCKVGLYEEIGRVCSGHCTASTTRCRQVHSLYEERLCGSSQITVGFLVKLLTAVMLDGSYDGQSYNCNERIHGEREPRLERSSLLNDKSVENV